MLTNEFWQTGQLILVPTGNVIRDGQLVADNPVVKEAYERYTGLEASFAQAITVVGGNSDNPMYGLIISPEFPKRKMGLLQVGAWGDSISDAAMRVSLAALGWFLFSYPPLIVQLQHVRIWDFEGKRLK